MCCSALAAAHQSRCCPRFRFRRHPWTLRHGLSPPSPRAASLPLAAHYHPLPARAAVIGYQISYAVPILLRVTTGREAFVQGAFSLGKWSLAVHWTAGIWLVLSSLIFFWPMRWPVVVSGVNGGTADTDNMNCELRGAHERSVASSRGQPLSTAAAAARVDGRFRPHA